MVIMSFVQLELNNGFEMAGIHRNIQIYMSTCTCMYMFRVIICIIFIGPRVKILVSRVTVQAHVHVCTCKAHIACMYM